MSNQLGPISIDSSSDSGVFSTGGGLGLQTSSSEVVPVSTSATASVSFSTSVDDSSRASPTASQSRTSSATRDVLSTASPGGDVSATASNSDRSGITGAQLAGGIVGTFFGVAIVAGILLWWILHRQGHGRRRSKPDFLWQSHESGSKKESPVKQRSSMSNDASLPSSWQLYIPQGPDDPAVCAAIKSFLDHVDMHVDNFYGPAPSELEIDNSTMRALAEIDSGKLPKPITTMMQDERLVRPTIKHCLAHLLVQGITPSARSTFILLPPHLAAIPRPTPETSRLADGNKDVRPQAYSQWKVLSAYLDARPEENTSFLSNRDLSAVEVLDLMAVAFGPWRIRRRPRPHDGVQSEIPSQSVSDLDNDSACQKHMKSVIGLASKAGIILLSQPAGMEFLWSRNAKDISDQRASLVSRTSRARNELLVVYPGLWKVTDRTGSPLQGPLCLISPVTAPFQTLSLVAY